MRYFIFIFLFYLSSCKNHIDIEKIEEREHGLRYIKGTNDLVNGKVVLKHDNGKIAELYNYKAGKAIGEWFAYGFKGEITSQGFGTEIKKYEDKLEGTDLTYCILSIVLLKNFSYATLYMDNRAVFTEKEKLLHLSKEIFDDYSDKYKIENLLIFDKNHEYSISKKPAMGTSYIFDTIHDSKINKINIH